MKEILKMTLKLFVITFIAGALLGGTYFITKDPIAEQEIRQATEARQQVLPEAASFEAVDMTAISADEAYGSITEVYTGKDDCADDRQRVQAGHCADRGYQERRNGERRQHWQS